MTIASTPLPGNIHRRFGKLFYGIDAAALTANVDLKVDANGAPDQSQNPSAVFIGATEAGYAFEATPTYYEETIDESQSPLEVGVDKVDAQVTFDMVEVLDLARIAQMVPHAAYSANAVAGVVTQRLKAGTDSRLVLPTLSIALISPVKSGGWLCLILFKAFNNGPHQLMFQKTNRAKQTVTLKALSDPTRDDGDRLYREQYILP